MTDEEAAKIGHALWAVMERSAYVQILRDGTSPWVVTTVTEGHCNAHEETLLAALQAAAVKHDDEMRDCSDCGGNGMYAVHVPAQRKSPERAHFENKWCDCPVGERKKKWYQSYFAPKRLGEQDLMEGSD